MNEKEIETFCPKNRSDWRNWLEVNHMQADAIWVVFYKKKSPNYNLSWSESVDEALCFGWIDSTKKAVDEEKFIQYFTRRNPKSNWSKINKDKVKALIDQGHMTKAGYESIAIAKENGSWTLLDEVEAIVVPKDLKEALVNHKGSSAYFNSLSNSVKKGLLYWVVSAKRKETRQKRILEIAENACKNQKPKQFR